MDTGGRKRTRDPGGKLEATGRGSAVQLQTIAQVVAMARSATGKATPPADAKLVAWLQGQEITTGEDFISLSKDALSSMSGAPGASLLRAIVAPHGHWQYSHRHPA